MPVRRIVVIAAILLGVVLLGLVAFVATFDANRYKPQLIELVEEQTGRRLALPGALSLSLWPHLALTSGPASLSGPRGEGQAMRFESGRVAIALRPLLSRELAVEGVTLTGVRVDAADDGSGLRLEEGALAADRIETGKTGRLELNGRLRSSDGSTDMGLELAARYVPDFGARRVQFEELDARLDGTGGGIHGVNARISARLLADFAGGTYDASALTVNATPPTGPALKLSGTARFDSRESNASLALDGSLDDSRLRLSATAKQLDPLAVEYELAADEIDVDRLRDKLAAARSTFPPFGPVPGAGDSASGPAQPSADVQPAPAPAPPAPADAVARTVGPIASIDTQGTLKIEALRVSGLTINNLDARAVTGNGRIVVDPISGRLNGGELQARLGLSEAVHELIAKLSDVAAGGLIRDATGRDVLDGRGEFSVELSASGGNTDALLGTLSGAAALTLIDGAVKGIDLDQMIRQVRDALGGRLPVERGARSGERTPFSSLNAHFRIAEGVARSDDVDLRADWMRAQAAGQVDLRARALDWRVRATITGTPGGDPDPARRDAFDRLRGLTIPISLSGPYDDLRYRVDVEDLAG
ncbi:MAG TPA: AsmA family protein, partial [Burkholderiaceae bacterium]|nr:AsmA family protein [Burkholderiaceae bacterium]